MLSGGFGAKVAAHYAPTPMRVLCYGFAKTYYDRYDPAEVMHDNRLEPGAIRDDVLHTLADGVEFPRRPVARDGAFPRDTAA